MFSLHFLRICRIFLAAFGLVCAVAGVATLAADSAADSPTRFKAIFTERMRIETTDNATYLDNDALQGSSYARLRSSLTLQYFPVSRWEVGSRLTNEFRNYQVPETRQFTLDEVFVELLYVQADSLWGRPLSVVIGRQNILLGEGFVVWDGGPGDGSRSSYFNAVRTNWAFSPKSTLSLMYINDPRQDNILPVIHDQEKVLVEQPEQGFVAYYAGVVGRSGLQGYFIHKRIGPDGEKPDAQINCPGVRLQMPLDTHFTVTSEIAGQIGKWGAADQRAFGGYAYVDYRTGWPVHFPKTLTVGGLYLSGDDPTTSNYEGWEPMFGRWPKWSESYIYTLARERAVAYWSNIASVYLKTLVPLVPDVSLDAEYHHLMAPQSADSTHAYPGGTGKVRGDLFIAKLMYQMNPHLSGHLIWEHLLPGNFYFKGANPSSWLRMEMMLKF